jgi:hypothetical protein
LPIHNDTTSEENVNTADFKKWMTNTQLVEATDSNRAWYERTQASIEEKKADYLRKWNVMLPADKALLTLKPEDGV